jgi:hypothetical protein
MSDSIPAPALNQGAGYGVVIGLGAFFAIGMIFITNYLAKKGNVDDKEEFAVAKRSIGVGLTAAGVISSWTWSTTLLSSCGVAYQYGVAGFVHLAYNHAALIGRGHRAFFYAACNSTQVSESPFGGAASDSAQIMVFSNLAIQTKRKAPNAHSRLPTRSCRCQLTGCSVSRNYSRPLRKVQPSVFYVLFPECQHSGRLVNPAWRRCGHQLAHRNVKSVNLP